ncbi:MAG: DUF1266 domain-containing protein [Lachnospiraceae bacterium]|nr:DUF1266 domain-containing protein [Lachnospiraceae bacterium]
MKKSTIQKHKWMLIVCMTFLILLAGCGNRQQDAERVSKEEKEEERVSYDEQGKEFVYLEQRELNDINDRRYKYTTYMPIGCDVNDGYASYTDHGLSYTADVDSFGDQEEQYDSFEYGFEVTMEYTHEPVDDYTDVSTSGVLSNGDDRYYIITARGIDYEGVPFEMRRLEYMEMQPTGACINWSLYMYIDYADEETDLIIGELEECFDVDLEQMKTSSPFTVDEQDQDVYLVKKGHKELEDMEGYQYLGIVDISDYYKESFCKILLPKSREVNVRTDHAYSYLHGVQISADVQEFYYGNTLMDNMKEVADSRYDSRENDINVIRNLGRSDMTPVPGFNDALFMEMFYEKKGNGSDQYFLKAEIFDYIRMDSEHYLAIEIFLSGEEYDSSTNTVIRELENAYGIDLSKYYNKTSDEEEGHDEIVDGIVPLVTMASLMKDGGDEERETLPDTILWFNATYAPLTYSNGWDWKIVGGVEPTEEMIAIKRYGLQSSWYVSDRESALATAENLKENGHRKICREYMEELDELGLLDLEEKEFRREFLKSGIEDKDYRYAIAYNMHQAGFSADDMTAWDLCRVNQLYADFYICGYMTYEEAMDASLENSLILQELYPSWEEMVEGYMMGYQFWSRDSDTSDDSPTRERYRFYEMLRQSQDSPYMLDWNMKLEKSW